MCAWGQGRFQISASESLFHICPLGMFLCFATSPLPLQTRPSLGDFLSPILGPPSFWSCDWRDTVPACQHRPHSLRKCILAIAFWDLPPGPPHHMPQLNISASALHSQCRFCLIAAWFDLRPDLMYFRLLYFCFSHKFAEKRVLWGFSLSPCCYVYFPGRFVSITLLCPYQKVQHKIFIQLCNYNSDNCVAILLF